MALRAYCVDAEVEVLLGGEVFAEQRLDDPPLVEPEVVDENEEYLLTVVDEGEYLGLEELVAHQGVFAAGNPLFVVLLDKLGKGAVGLALLQGEEFVHVALGLGELQFPEYQFLVHLVPVGPRIGVVYLAADVLELLPVVARGLLEDNLLVVEILLD